MSQPLIVPLDGSAVAEAALPWATLLARTHERPILLVQALAWPTTMWTPTTNGYLTPDTYEQIRTANYEEATEYLGTVRHRLAAEGVRAEAVVREGYPAATILDLADEHAAAAIVLGTHGRGGLTRWVLGSVAESVLAQATIPVLLVPASEGALAQPPALTPLLVALDGSPLAERALDLARDVAPDGSTLALLRVVPPVERLMRVGGGVSVHLDPAATEQAIEQAEAYLQRVAQTVPATRFGVQTAVRTGRAADEILAAAHEGAASLLVLSTHGRTGPQRLLLGSVADEVVRRAETAVLLVSARALAARATGPFTVKDLMTRDLATVAENEPVPSVLRKLLRQGVSAAPVIDGRGRLVGVISEHDLLVWQQRLTDLLAKEPGLAPDEYARRLATRTARDLMAAPTVTIEEDASLAAAIHLFVDRRQRRLPVVRGGQLVGMLSRADVLRALVQQWETAATAAPPPQPTGPRAHA